jgi:hypothetical protein
MCLLCMSLQNYVIISNPRKKLCKKNKNATHYELTLNSYFIKIFDKLKYFSLLCLQF